MAEVTIKSFCIDEMWRTDERVEVYVDGVFIGNGRYGGEPEDNTAGRTYGWVEPLLEKLAKSLGATVTNISFR